MNSILKSIGVTLCLLGGLALADSLGVMRFDSPVIRWTLRWGRDAAWIIRGGMLLAGFSLVFATPRGDD